MQTHQKRVMAINDLSCFGKCSLTVALPILSAAGFEACPIPTALLSTHTGGFEGYTFKNLEDQMMPVAEHWRKENISFDAIYSGYLGSFEQLEIVKDIIDKFPDSSLVLIDPVMGDNGRLYAGFSEEFTEGMLKLCRSADIIVPNITEAALMLKMQYKQLYEEEEITEYAEAFFRNGIANAVITGIHMRENTVACAVCCKGSVSLVKSEKIGGIYHGTGDVFASTLLAAMLHGKNPEEATRLAADFVCRCLTITKKRYGHTHYGVDFENVLLDFWEKIVQKV